MINIRKLRSLPPGTRRRKIAVVLQAIENDLLSGNLPDIPYLKGILAVIAEDGGFPSAVREDALRTVKTAVEAENGSLIRSCNNLRHQIMRYLGTEPADWDLEGKGEIGERRERIVRPFRIYLDDIRSPFNVGSIFRTAESFGVERIICSPGTASPLHNRARRTAMGCIDRVPWETGGIGAVTEPVFALECGGTPLDDFPFPEEGTVIIGSEELGVGPEGLKRSGDSLGRVTIPLYGIKGSINVSVAFGILLRAWFAKTGNQSDKA